MARFTIAHMYPELMNLYGDRGNLICLQKRLEWYGQDCAIKRLELGDELDLAGFDMLFMGGGSDREQGLVYNDLIQKAKRLQAEIEAGLPMLCICGAYQLLGSYYKALDGQVLEGLEIFGFHTESRPGRLIGNIVIASEINRQSGTVIGFENHGGRTYFDDKSLQPLGTVIKGYGNNGEDKTEGLRFQNLVGTYLHGPLLPKNPLLADFFIQAMAERKGIIIDQELDNSIENMAHDQVERRIMSV